MVLLGDCGVSVVWSGEDCVRYDALGSGIAGNSALMQCRAPVSNTVARLSDSREIRQLRFGVQGAPKPNLEQLRGREGTRMRNIYSRQAEHTGVEWRGWSCIPRARKTGYPMDQAFTAALMSLHVMVHSVLSALGCSPGLGFVRADTARGFIYEISEPCNAETSFPAALDVVSGRGWFAIDRGARIPRDYTPKRSRSKRFARDIRWLLAEDSDTVASWHKNDVGLMRWDIQRNVSAGKIYESPGP